MDWDFNQQERKQEMESFRDRKCTSALDQTCDFLQDLWQCELFEKQCV